MITKVRIRNWQSLRQVDLDLGRYTVIVGASSSGKTALMRAFRALAFNVRGSAAITRGHSTAAITAELDDGWVTLEYKSGAWRYHTVLLGHEETYTSLGGAVPAAITNILRIAPVPTSGTSINFAGQFDRPYLLSSDDSGASVARTLGELTNVTIILEAVREANRRRAAIASTLKVRRDDLAALTASAGQFSGLHERAKALSVAEEHLERARAIRGTAGALQARLRELKAAYAVMERARVPTVPDGEVLMAAFARLQALRSLLVRMAEARTVETRAVLRQSEWRGTESQLEQRLERLLADAGACPTCGQPTTDRIQSST